MGGASALPRGLYTTPNTPLTPLVHPSPASQPTRCTSSLWHSHKGAFEVRWLKYTIWIVLQNEERGSVEYSSHAYAEAEPGAASPLTQSRFASGNRLFGTVLGTIRMAHDSCLAHDRLHRCAARGSPPLMLISLVNFTTKPFLPPNLPPNDRLRWLILYTGLYHITINESVLYYNKRICIPMPRARI